MKFSGFPKKDILMVLKFMSSKNYWALLDT